MLTLKTVHKATSCITFVTNFPLRTLIFGTQPTTTFKVEVLQMLSLTCYYSVGPQNRLNHWPVSPAPSSSLSLTLTTTLSAQAFPLPPSSWKPRRTPPEPRGLKMKESRLPGLRKAQQPFSLSCHQFLPSWEKTLPLLLVLPCLIFSLPPQTLLSLVQHKLLAGLWNLVKLELLVPHVILMWGLLSSCTPERYLF